MLSLIKDRQIEGLVSFVSIIEGNADSIKIKPTNVGKTVVEYNEEDEYVSEYIKMLVKVDEAS